MGLNYPEPPNTPKMEHRPSMRAHSPRPNTHRQRSNSFPIVEALGCSTPEAQLILAEGRAAVRKRRARGRRNKSFNDEHITTFNPRDHLKFLDVPAESQGIQERTLSHAKSCHARLPSNATDRSTSTIVPYNRDSDEAHSDASPTSPLGNYSANLAQFIKAQLRSIPTYQVPHEGTMPLSPSSCPDFSFPMRVPSQSSERSIRRPLEAPKLIEIPPVRPPAKSAFSAWSSTDDETDDDDAFPLPEQNHLIHVVSKTSNYTPSVLGYYEASNNASFLFSSTPMDEDEDGPNTAKGYAFPDSPALPDSTTEHNTAENGYPSSCLSRPQLTSSSAPSIASSTASGISSSYFECKRPITLAPELKDRIVAALTPPHPNGKVITAISPWEGAPITNVHDVFVESQQRVHVDGMSFDMLKNFAPSRVTTPC